MKEISCKNAEDQPLLTKKSFTFAFHFENRGEMKKDIHPENYRIVVFKDFSSGDAFLAKSSAPTKDSIKWEDGNEYPLIKLEISSSSHPFYTGKMKFVDTAGRIDKFNKKFAKTKFAKSE